MEIAMTTVEAGMVGDIVVVILMVIELLAVAVLAQLQAVVVRV